MIEAFITYKKNFSFPDNIQGNDEDISISDFSSVLDFLNTQGENACILTGNEPLLHSQLDRLLTIAGKKKNFIILETGGFPTKKLNHIFHEYKLLLRIKIYPPNIYPEGKRDELLENVCGILNQNIPLEISIIIDDFTECLKFPYSILKKGGISKLHIKILPEAVRKVEEVNLKKLQHVFNDISCELFKIIRQALQKKALVTLDCVGPPCIFSDKEFGFLAKVGALPRRCLPYPGVLPNLYVYHCRPLIPQAARKLSSFKEFYAIRDHFFNRYKELQFESYLFQECKECFSRQVEGCLGGCLYLKRSKNKKE